MNIYNPQMYDESKTARKQKGNQSGRVFYIILIGLPASRSCRNRTCVVCV